MRRICLTILSALAVLFCLRVTGQLLVAFFQVTWLPPMESWMSGAVSYPVLLTLQIGIITLMGKICWDIQHRDGYFYQPSERLGRFFLEAGAFYFLIMVMRYSMRMSLYPHERWLGGALPIFFHCVLALFVMFYGAYHLLSVVKTRQRKTWTPIVCRALAATGLLVWLTYQLAPAVMAHTFHLRPAQYAVSIERDVQIPVEDGVVLVADVYHPQHLERSPTIIVRIPYTKTINNMITANLMGRLWAERGYTAVIQCTRGKGD
ncbi:MAG: CocE/NonD family hydrolase [Candidatus Obscuribacterales bacterium]